MSDFLNHYLQPVIEGGKSYVKDTNYILEKPKELGKVPPNAILAQWMQLAFIPASCMTQDSNVYMKRWNKEMIKVFQRQI